MAADAPAAPAAAAATPVATTPAPASVPSSVPPSAPPSVPKNDGAPAEPAKPAAAPATEPRKTILGGEPAKAGDPPKKDEPAKQPEGAPEKYADFKLPEGVTANQKLMEAFNATAKELGLSQEKAQKLVDLQAQNVKAEIDERLSAFNTQVETWEKETRAHFGADADKKFGLAARAMEQLGTPELRTFLNEAGIGSQIELVKMFVKAGELLAEDQPVDGKRAGGEAASTASLMFPTMEKKK